jgi:hypothetical protein
MTMIIDGTNRVTFPNSTVQASAGQVLQVVQGTTSSQTSTTTTYPTYTATNLTASITPKFSNSKILIIVSTNIITTSSSTFCTIYRNSTNLGGGANSMFFGTQVNTSQWLASGTSYLDSPATTSSTTYTLYISPQGGTAYANWSQATNTIILMEIAA